MKESFYHGLYSRIMMGSRVALGSLKVGLWASGKYAEALSTTGLGHYWELCKWYLCGLAAL